MAKKRYRTEKDSLGEVKIPFNALWGPPKHREQLTIFQSVELHLTFLSAEAFLRQWELLKRQRLEQIKA